MSTNNMNTKYTPTPMTACQRLVLRELSSYVLFPGYCELMMDTGLKSYKAVDWVLDALERRALVSRDAYGDYIVTDAGRAALLSARKSEVTK